jgi:hypothetical protein
MSESLYFAVMNPASFFHYILQLQARSHRFFVKLVTGPITLVLTVSDGARWQYRGMFVLLPWRTL